MYQISAKPDNRLIFGKVKSYKNGAIWGEGTLYIYVTKIT